MCGAPRSGQRGWSTCTPSRVHIADVFPLRNRVSLKEAFEGLELGEGKPSRPVLRGPGGRKAAWLLGSNPDGHRADRYREVERDFRIAPGSR